MKHMDAVVVFRRGSKVPPLNKAELFSSTQHQQHQPRGVERNCDMRLRPFRWAPHRTGSCMYMLSCVMPCVRGLNEMLGWKALARGFKCCFKWLPQWASLSLSPAMSLYQSSGCPCG